MDFDKVGFGKALQSIRNELGLTLEEVSFLAGVSEKTVYRIEYGINKVTERTLDRLSIAYKMDLTPIYNQFLKTPKNTLKSLVNVAEKSLFDNDFENIEKCINELTKIPLKELSLYDEAFVKYYMNLLLATYVDLKDNNRAEALNILKKSLKNGIYNFDFKKYKNFNYSSIEKRILMNICSLSYDFYGNNNLFVDILSHLASMSNKDNTLFPKIILNLASAYFMENDCKKTLCLVDEGISYCINNKCFEVLPMLFFRKFTAEVILDAENHIDTFKKAIFAAEVNNQEYLKKSFTKSAEKIYGIKVD